MNWVCHHRGGLVFMLAMTGVLLIYILKARMQCQTDSTKETSPHEWHLLESFMIHDIFTTSSPMARKANMWALFFACVGPNRYLREMSWQYLALHTWCIDVYIHDWSGVLPVFVLKINMEHDGTRWIVGFDYLKNVAFTRQLQEASSIIGLLILVEGLQGLSWVLSTQGWWEEYLLVLMLHPDTSSTSQSNITLRHAEVCWVLQVFPTVPKISKL